MKDLRILQWNCRSVLNKWGEITKIAENYDIICLNETFLKDDIERNLKDFFFISFNQPKTVHGGGSIIFIRSFLNYKKIENIKFPKGIEWIGIEIEWNNKILEIHHFYRSPSLYIRADEWKKNF